jgi:cell division protein ZapE
MSRAPAADSPLGRYLAGVASGSWQDDAHQRKVLAELTRIHEELRVTQPQTMLQRWRQLWQPPGGVRGLYLHGGVGRGKTFMMDMFFDGAPTEHKQRLHFHRFMGRVHADLAQLKDRSDPLAVVADHFAERARVLCFDEFFVSDIGDAMLLATSNVAPKNLYKDGLQRARFLPAIAALEKHCKVLELVSPQDYRLRALTQAAVYHQPLGAAADAELEAAFAQLAPAQQNTRGLLTVNDRQIPVKRRASDLIWFEFDAICRGPRAVPDYIEIAQSFPTVMISGVPVFGINDENEAKRFVHLVDEFYDRSVKLVLSAAAGPTQLYTGERLRLEFERTGSRLIEMQSQAYLQREHHP